MKIKRNRMIAFRVTDDQYRSLCEKAALEGVALSQYVRGRVIKAESLEARISRLEMVIAPSELLAVAKGSM